MEEKGVKALARFNMLIPLEVHEEIVRVSDLYKMPMSKLYIVGAQIVIDIIKQNYGITEEEIKRIRSEKPQDVDIEKFTPPENLALIADLVEGIPIYISDHDEKKKESKIITDEWLGHQLDIQWNDLIEIQHSMHVKERYKHFENNKEITINWFQKYKIPVTNENFDRLLNLKTKKCIT